MGNFLADVGRSNIAGTTAQTIGAINAMRTTEANVALSQEQLERMKRINVKEQQDEEEANKPIAIESFASGFEGGEQGPMFKMIYDHVDKRGMIDHSQGGLGTIKKADSKELQEAILEPNFASKLSRTRIDYWRGQLNQVNASLQEKPDDQKLRAAKEQFNTGLQQAQYQDKAMADALKAEQEAKKKTAPTGQMGQFYSMHGRLPESTEELRTFLNETRLPPHPTVSERDMMRRQGATVELQEIAKQDPNKAYAHGIKMNEDGTVYINPITNAPTVLPNFTKVMGKRGGVKVAKEAGEYRDDCIELEELIKDPEVKKNLEWADEEGLWDRTAGKWSNTINRWMLKKGIAANSKTTTAVARIQMLASSKRKEFLGTAVTATELESILGWMPSGGDSYSSMLVKINLAVKEGDEVFRRYLDLYKDVANMSPFYKAFGIERFPTKAASSGLGDLRNKYGLE